MSTENRSVKTLPIKSIKQVTSETLNYIENRKKGLEKSMKVKSKKINKAFLDGFDWNRIITIAGMSGSGKSTLVRQWMREFCDLNPDEKFEILSFQFEMMGTDEVARDLSAKLKVNIKQLYSADQSLPDDIMEKAKKAAAELENYPISVVDNMGTVRDILDTVLYFVGENKLRENKKKLIITIDHSLLVKPEQNSKDKETVDQLMYALVELKKLLASMGVPNMIFIISQLNRNIESSDRVLNPKLHYPNKTDLFGASSVYFSSDYVIILHRPALIEGLGNWYGPAKKKFPMGLPVYHPSNGDITMVYLHIIKERFGTSSILAFSDNLASSTLEEATLTS